MPPDPALRALLRDASRRFVERAEQGPWPTRDSHHLDWRPDEIVAHVATIVDYFRAIVLGEGSPVESLRALTSTNKAGIERHLPSAWPDLLSHISEGVAAIADGVPDDHLGSYAWHGMIPISADETLGVLTGELLVHEWDLARTLRRRPRLTRADCLVLIPAMQGIFPHVLAPDAHEVNATWRIHVAGLEPFDLRVVRGVMEVGAASGRPDCHLRARPRPFVLHAYQRIGRARVALTGGAIAYGRRPLLGLRLNQILEVP